MSTERAALYRQRAAESELKATKATAEQSRRAWLIVAREWKKMAVREELKDSVDALEKSRQSPIRSRQYPTSSALDELIKLTR